MATFPSEDTVTVASFTAPPNTNSRMILNRPTPSLSEPLVGASVDVETETAAVVVDAMLADDVDEESAAGPVKKKLPATGTPSPSSCANVVRLNLVISVDAFTKPDAARAKLSGCRKSSSVYLPRPRRRVR